MKHSDASEYSFPVKEKCRIVLADCARAIFNICQMLLTKSSTNLPSIKVPNDRISQGLSYTLGNTLRWSIDSADKGTRMG